jgi:hypothetical protein
MSLSEAVQKAFALYEQEHRTPAPWESVASAFGYSSTSSAVASAIAALKHFGLIDELGRGADRRIRLSELGLDTAIEPAGSEARRSALQKAALSPEIFAELYTEFGRQGSDATLKTYLLRRGFNQKAAGPIIRYYRETIEFAGLDREARIDSESSETKSEEFMELKNRPNFFVGREMANSQPTASGVPVAVPMRDGSFSVVTIPRMDSVSFDFLMRMLENYRDVIISPQRDESPVEIEVRDIASRD